MSEAIVIGGWRAIPNPNGGYDIHAKSGHDSYRGWAGTKEAATKWLEDSSGVTYSSLPELHKDDITVIPEEKQAILKFPFRRNDYYQHTFYYKGDVCLGSIQTKRVNGRESYLTLPAGMNHCIPSASLQWLCEANGFRLVE
jgi:hypothetical protein